MFQIASLMAEWEKLISNFTDDAELTKKLWEEIYLHYSSKKRHYHNLQHIHELLLQATNFKTEITDHNTLLFAIWYHDIIYKAHKKDNEEASACFAEKSLKLLEIDPKRIKKCFNLIVSTKKHEVLVSSDGDNEWLLDFDLSILGKDWDTYLNYSQLIRREYSLYPNLVYKPGRKKALLHFLNRERLYFTDTYFNAFEEQARSNIKKELELL